MAEQERGERDSPGAVNEQYALSQPCPLAAFDRLLHLHRGYFSPKAKQPTTYQSIIKGTYGATITSILRGFSVPHVPFSTRGCVAKPLHIKKGK